MFLNKFLKKPTPSIHPPAGLITDITDLDEFKQRLGIKARAKTLWRPIKYLDILLEQSWNVNKTFRSNSGKIRTVGIHDSFPTYKDTTELSELFSDGTATNLLDDGGRQSQNPTKSTYGARRASYVCSLLLARVDVNP